MNVSWRRLQHSPVKSRGFTLVEVLVALFIVGVALPAMVMRMQGIIDHTIHIEEKTYAYWIAENQLQELLIEQRLSKKLTKQKKHNDTLDFGGREWFWSAEVIQTELPEMFRVNMAVSRDVKESPLANISGFIYEPAETGTTP